jgi:hypothetical protein
MEITCWLPEAEAALAQVERGWLPEAEAALAQVERG